MKRIKATKTNIEKLEHPTGKKPDRYFASNCSALCIFVQPQPWLVKSYYGSFGKIIIQPDGKQKRTGRYKYICRVGDKPLEAVMEEVKLNLKEWKNENSGGWKDFIKSHKDPKVIKLSHGGNVKENSYAQLIDDYDNNIEVIEIDGVKESLTHYIKRMGGVKDD